MIRRTLLGTVILLLAFAGIGALALLTHQPSARPWNTLVGHGIGIVAAVFAMVITGAHHLPDPILTGVLSWQRELASALAVTLTFLVQTLFRASHAPAAATALLLTLGAVDPELRDIAVLCTGVILITVLGEAGRWAITHFAAPRALPELQTKEI
jgi:CBS-domain-containing membrane protein